MAPISIKYVLDEKNVLCSIIATIIKEGGCSDAWKLFARQCANGSSQFQVIGFDQSYSTVAHADSFIIDIAIVDMPRLTDRTLDISNAFHNTNVTIH